MVSCRVDTARKSQRSTLGEDAQAWYVEQAELLRARRFGELDVDVIAEELEDLGRSERRELRSRLAVVLAHLLKWQFQPERRGRSWLNSIERERDRIAVHLDDNPSLGREIGNIVAEAYRLARRDAAREAELALSLLPEDCPYAISDLLREGWLPDES